MIAGLRVLAVIPARGGSKGLPRKNLRPLAGRPLIAWTIDAAKASRYLDRTILSTEDEEIARVGASLQCDVPFLRPAELARDDSPGIAPVLHALEQLPGYDVLVLLQPTSPLRIAADIDGCLERLVEANAASCVGVREAEDHPYWCYRENPQARLVPFVDAEQVTRRQDLPRAFAINGAVYAARVPKLVELRTFLPADTVPFEMPRERSLDIDTAADLALAEAALSGPSAKAYTA